MIARHGAFSALCLAAALVLAQPAAQAARIIDQPEDAYELMLGLVTMPAGETGSVQFRQCADCETKTVRVGLETTYTLNGQRMTFTDFRRAVSDIRATSGGNEMTAVYLYYDTKTGVVTRMVVSRLG